MYYDNNERAITLSQISNFSGCSPMVPLQFVSEYNTLKDLGLLEVVSLPPSEGVSAGEFFKIPSDVERFICSDGKESRLGALSRDKNSKLVFPDKIRERELFYSAQVVEQVDKLTSSLQEENLLGIQKRLAEHKMPVGISAILYGESGTGKTETVYQIARKSGRPVFHVNIGDILSEWHNATEKKLGELFMQYQKMVEQCRSRKEPMPICLFNEADVIFGRRLNPPRQAVEIAENRIKEKYFFIDETFEQKRFENANDVYFAYEYRDGSKDIVYFKGLTTIEETGNSIQYLRDLSIVTVDSNGKLYRTMTVPYAKVLPVSVEALNVSIRIFV
jgi:hypothetical protein